MNRENIIIVVGLFALCAGVMFQPLEQSAREVLLVIVGGLLTHLRTHGMAGAESQNVGKQTINMAGSNPTPPPTDLPEAAAVEPQTPESTGKPSPIPLPQSRANRPQATPEGS